MAATTFSTTDPTQDRTIEASFEFGENLQDAIAKFGEEAVMSGFVAAAKVDLQAMVRRLMRSKTGEGDAARDYTDEEILTKVVEWKPGVKTRQAADPLAKVKALLGKMSNEARADLLAKLAATADAEEIEG